MGFLFRVLVNAFAIYLVAEIVPGITVASVPAALGAGLVLGLINAVVRPILVVLTLPVTLLTLGLFLLVLNAFCLWLTSLLVKGFEVHGFLAAMFGSLLVRDRKSTRLNSSHLVISYAVFCLKKK